MPDRWPHLGEEFEQTPACRRAAHVDCPHLHGAGGGFNPRRLRFEFGEQLCECSCHASCPVQYETKRLTISKGTWYTSCTCAGAEVARQRLDRRNKDSAEVREERQRLRNADREAVEATPARASGRSREEIREIYIAERRARNLQVPAEPVLDAVVEHITTGNPLPAIRVLGETLFQTGKGINDAMSRPRGRQAKGSTGGSNKSE
jgi:hypothetical protein